MQIYEKNVVFHSLCLQFMCWFGLLEWPTCPSRTELRILTRIAGYYVNSVPITASASQTSFTMAKSVTKVYGGIEFFVIDIKSTFLIPIKSHLNCVN